MLLDLSFPNLSILRPFGLILQRAPGILHERRIKCESTNNLCACSMCRRIESCIHDCFLEKIRRGGCHWYDLHWPTRAGQFYKLRILQGHRICLSTNGKHGIANALRSKIFQDLICASLVPARRMPRPSAMWMRSLVCELQANPKTFSSAPITSSGLSPPPSASTESKKLRILEGS